MSKKLLFLLVMYIIACLFFLAYRARAEHYTPWEVEYACEGAMKQFGNNIMGLLKEGYSPAQIKEGIHGGSEKWREAEKTLVDAIASNDMTKVQTIFFKTVDLCVAYEYPLVNKEKI